MQTFLNVDSGFMDILSMVSCQQQLVYSSKYSISQRKIHGNTCEISSTKSN